MRRRFIFHKPVLESLSPMVGVWWPGRVIDLLNRLPPAALHFGGMAEETCADFIVAFAALTQEDHYLPLEVLNLWLRWERVDQALTAEIDTRERADQWRAWLFEEIGHLYADVEDRRTLPVLVELSPPYHVTQGGKVLCRRVDRASERWEPGQPLWVAAGRGGGRTRRRT
jgi:hypothetical protein